MTTQQRPATDDSDLRRWVVTLVCPDAPGIVHAMSGAIVGLGANITEMHQFSSNTGRYFQRIALSAPAGADVDGALRPVAERLDGTLGVDDADRRIRTLVLASKAPHAVQDLLVRQRSGWLPIDIRGVLANHPTLEPLVAFHGVPFEHRAVTPETKLRFERRVRELVTDQRIELVVLARYMQILTPELCAFLRGRAINIHHSFLPGFKGANPYRQAHDRGVKLIGATAHFVTADLDEGPIIEQNVVRVDHAKSVPELVALGQGEESRTLTAAVKLFAEHRVLLDGARTVIFG